ncbi:MAG: L,D-transpeptidase family protein [Verrucomicrobia bacterium]|nr:L,D-transpeptidase family protein [Verrucomicrobiota bacterium]MBV8276930.1 L,D-transpeptidase family protein [Verrucomicrobiota bacterium]
MTPGILLFYLVLSSSFDEASKECAAFRQHQLEEAVFANNAQECINALEVNGNPDGIVDLTPARLADLNLHSHRLYHYFAEETKATPLILAASLGEDDVCSALLAHKAKLFEKSQWGWIAAQYAARMEHPELAGRLMETDPLSAHFSILIDLSQQKVVLYKDGAAVVTGKISTGRKGYDTPPGHYLVTDKVRMQRSTIYKVPMPYFLRLSFSEYGIHQGVNPGRPASHGCIRIGEETIAKTVYDQTPIGTLVTIE